MKGYRNKNTERSCSNAGREKHWYHRSGDWKPEELEELCMKLELFADQLLGQMQRSRTEPPAA